MRRGWLLAVLLVMGVACLGQGRLPATRDSLDRMNALRVDLLGPMMVLGYWGYDDFPFRLQIEYERKLSMKFPFAVVAAFEYAKIRESFMELWQFLPGFHVQGSLWLGGNIETTHVSGYLGLRGTWWLPFATHRVGLFVVPSLGYGKRWGRKMSLLLNGSCCDYDVSEFGVTPRVRFGFSYPLGRRLGLEVAVDAFHLKLLGAGRRMWIPIPLVNLEWRF